jgi:dTDP-L-rhamnose 4-epimerase
MSIYGEGEYRLPDGRRVAPPLRSREQLEAKMWDLMAEGSRLEPAATPESKPLNPASIYAINKRDHEEMFLVVGRALGVPTIALRLFNTYGSRQALSNPYTGVAAIFIARLMNDRAPLIFEDGEQQRDFVHVGDVADGFVAALENEQPIWDAFNLGSGRPLTIRQVAMLLADRLGKPIAPQILNEHRVGDIRHCYADTSRFDSVFGRRRRTTFEEGLPELLDWVAQASRPIDRTQRSLAELAASGLIA